MSEAKARPRRIHPLALSMKAIGYLTSPETAPGKVFVAGERRLTRVFERLSQNDTYLDLAGKAMRAGFHLRRDTVSAAEAWLHLFRLPTAGDVSALRGELRAVHDEVEALGAQLEVVMEALEKQRAGEQRDVGQSLPRAGEQRAEEQRAGEQRSEKGGAP